MGFLTFLALLGLAVAVVKLWQRLGEISDAQSRLAIDLLELKRRQDDLAHEWRTQAKTPPVPGDATAAAPVVPPPPSVPPPPLPQTTPDEPPAAVPPPPARKVRIVAPGRAGEIKIGRASRENAGTGESWLEPAAAGSSGSESFGVALRTLFSFFTTGNVVAKVGVIIVFFGVAFLLRYAAERGMLPIEYRLMGTAAAALVLLGIGWRLRTSRREYAVVLQGGAVGLLYLTIFAAFRLYALLPASLTFALLLVVVAFSGVLAVVQNAIPLAVLGTSGGFLAPILASTGAGSHVALFSYYAALNLGVLGIAWFRSWRFLNWLAFVFTFGIGVAWGAKYYQPELLATTEPFLVLFFLLFIAIAVLFAHRQPPQLRGYIDGSLVFGLPAIAFGMQSVLVGEIPFGRAYSALAVSAWYLVLARTLWRRDAALQALAESFLALGVAFLILVVPLAFDGHATAAAWALEGAALIWIGIRQQRRLARWVGALLLLGSGVAFGLMVTRPLNGLAVLNTRFLACAAIAVASVLAGRLLARARESLGRVDHVLEWILLLWGLAWWFAAVEVEILDHVPSRLEVSGSLLGIAVSGCVVALLARRWQWRAMTLATIPVGPMMWIWAVPLFVFEGRANPLAKGGWLAWPVAIATSYLIVFWSERVWPRLAAWSWHAATTWLLMFLTTWATAVEVRHLVPDAATWSFVIWSIVPALWVLAIPAFPRSRWPARDLPLLYAVVIPAAGVIVILQWFLAACGEEGAAAPLSYVPLLNPLELTQGLTILIAYRWWKRHASPGIHASSLRTVGSAVLGALAFVGINVVVARAVHFYLHVPFEVDDLVGSSVVQTGISILWAVTAAVLMAVARRQINRPVWIAGAGLLAALILKLFLIDLEHVGTVARIVSFLATGVLILLIGYFAPAPPRSASREEQST
jgi:uncharacterized membrane protein